ncbi:MAG: radical SAM protein [Dorea sp.]
MTREEIYQSIYTHDTIYLPPHEERCAPLEVSLGCSWHKCTFCDFTKDKFQIHPLEKIEYNIQILGQLQPNNPRLFFLGENAFCISTDYMLKILDLKDKYMTNVTSFAMYSRIDDITRKSDKELKLLKEKGLSALHIGVESGSDSILAARNKGISSQQTIHELHRLDEVGIDYYLTIIPGLGGRTFSRLHALETARMLNQVHPKNIWCLKLFLYENTELYKEEKRGHFDMMTPREILLEERLLLENLHVKDCLFEDTTVLDKYTIQGILPGQKRQLLDAVDYLLSIEI